METNRQHVLNTFRVTRVAETMYRDWEEKKTLRERGVIETVNRHVSTVIYRSTTKDIEDICKKTEHSLGNIKKKDVEGILLAKNWNPPYAFVHLFHYLMELLQRPPLWQEFTEYFYETDNGREMFGNDRAEQEILVKNHHLPHLERKYEEKKVNINNSEIIKKAGIDAANALQWRIGNAYYGFLRDIYTVVELRSRGLAVQSHPLADALFRTDCWVDNSLISLYVGNIEFRDQIEERHMGRKVLVDDLMRESAGRFNFVPITLPAAEKFGVVLLPSKEVLGEAEATIRGYQRD